MLSPSPKPEPRPEPEKLTVDGVYKFPVQHHEDKLIENFENDHIIEEKDINNKPAQLPPPENVKDNLSERDSDKLELIKRFVQALEDGHIQPFDF